ncbi:MAG: ABC transporter ATP-binding protein [Gammaproteobacteria bacterium]
MAETLVEVIGLTKSFGSIKAVDNISLSVNRGEVLGFLGPNGAGKSTSMKMITGFLTPTSGTIKISGNDISVNPIEAKASIGYLPEGAPAYGEMTPLNFLSFVAEVRGIDNSARASRVDEIIDKIHLERVAHQPIDTLSKGFKRRVGIAQAILHDPEILILDEPTDGLDPNQKHEIRALIKEMAADKAILISTHILEEVESVCTKATIISNGGVIFSGSPLELSSKSRYHNAITLVVSNKDVEKTTKILKELEEIMAIEHIAEAELTRVTLIPYSSEVEISSLVKARMADYECEILQLYIEQGRLDEVFRSLTNQQKSGEVIRS